MGLSMRVFAAATMLTWLSDVQAQPLRPPKYVRTPYVEVYRDPYGGKHIRTPYVEIHKPGYRVPPGFAGPPVYAFPDGRIPEEGMMRKEPSSLSAGRPTPANDFGQMDWQTLCQTIREANQRLNADLSRSPSAAFWTTSLKMSDIARLVPSNAVGPPAEAVRQQLQEIAHTLDALSGDPQGSSVVRLGSFRNLRGALREYTQPADQRAHRQLYSAAGELSRSLEQFATATTWQRYFALTPGSALAPDQRAGQPAKPTPEFATLLGRFDSVVQDPQFSMIAALPAFERMRDLLRAYVAEQPATTNPKAEELPAPLPDEVRRGTMRNHRSSEARESRADGPSMMKRRDVSSVTSIVMVTMSGGKHMATRFAHSMNTSPPDAKYSSMPSCMNSSSSRMR